MAIDPKDLNPGDKIWYLRKVKPNNRMEAIVKKNGKISIKIQDIFSSASSSGRCARTPNS